MILKLGSEDYLQVPYKAMDLLTSHPIRVSSAVSGKEGAKLQKRVWKELADKLEGIQPGILQNI